MQAFNVACSVDGGDGLKGNVPSGERLTDNGSCRNKKVIAQPGLERFSHGNDDGLLFSLGISGTRKIGQKEGCRENGNGKETTEHQAMIVDSSRFPHLRRYVRKTSPHAGDASRSGLSIDCLANAERSASVRMKQKTLSSMEKGATPCNQLDAISSNSPAARRFCPVFLLCRPRFPAAASKNSMSSTMSLSLARALRDSPVRFGAPRRITRCC